jgi:uncharacterized membrane protein
MFTEQWKAWVINTLIYVLICATPMIAIVGGFYVYLITEVSSRSPYSNQPPIGGGEILTFYALLFVAMVYLMLTGAYFTGAMHKAALKQLRGGKVEIRDLFSGGSTYFSILLYSILGAILTSIGSLLCIVPGLLVGGALFFSAPLIVERNLGPIEAMKTSYELTKKNIWMFTLFSFVVGLIAQAGSYACYVGLLATIPLMFTISAVSYRDLFGVAGAKSFNPNAPLGPGDYGHSYPPSYNQPPDAGYGQPGFTPYAPPSYEPPPTPTAAPSEPLLEHSVAPPNVEPPAPPPEGTMPLSSITSSAPPAAKINCSNCQMELPATAGFCPRCGNRVQRD